MASTEKIKELLGTGLSAEVVATTVGVTPGYISQLMSDVNFKEQVITLRAAALTAANSRDRKIDEIEDLLIDRLHEQVKTMQVYKPTDIQRCFMIVNNAKRRGTQAQQQLHLNSQTVNLIMPTKIINTYKTNHQGEVVEVEGQTMVSMSAHQLLNSKLVEDRKTDYDEVRKFLPSGGTADSGK